MDAMVDPSADVLFESIAEIADENGITHKAPRTDEEWQQVRRHAFVLLEAPNLLIMEGRKVAQPHERSENPQAELDRACESCHRHYWYPNDRRAQDAAKEQGLVD